MKQSVAVGAQLLWSGRYGCNNGHYGCTIVMSYIEINKAVSQWLLTFNLCVSVTWPLTCAFHMPCTHTPEIIDMHRGMCDNLSVTEVTTQLNRFRAVTPVWIHIWWWNDAYSLMLLRRGALLFFKVIPQISMSRGAKNRRILPRLAFLDCNSSLNSPMGTKWYTKLEVAYRVPTSVGISGKSRELSSVIPDREIVGNSIYFVLNSGKCVRRIFSSN